MGFDTTLLERRSPRKRNDDSHHGVVRLHAAEITRARQDGATWRSIAAALGLQISPDAVRQYYLAAIGKSIRRKRKSTTTDASETVIQGSRKLASPHAAASTMRATRAEPEVPASAGPVLPSDPLDPHGIYGGGEVSIEQLLAAITPPKSLP